MAKRRVRYADPDADIWSNVPPNDGEAWVWDDSHGRWIPTPVTGGSGVGAHEILSTTHTDTDSTDTEAEGDVLTFEGGQWIAKFPAGGAGLVHFDYVVDSSWTGTDGDSFVLDTGATSNVYTTIQAAVTAADGQTGPISILINEGAAAGVYAENVTIPGTMGNGDYLMFYGEGERKITWGLTTGDALTISDAENTYFFNNIRFRGSTSTGHSVTSGTSNISAHFDTCEFAASISADWAGAYFRRCTLESGVDVDSGHTPSTVHFSDCHITGASTWADDMTGYFFTECKWDSATQTITATDGTLSDIHFVNCNNSTGGTGGTWFTINGAGVDIGGLEFEGCKFAVPGTNGVIYFQNHGDVGSVRINGNNFKRTTASTNPYISAADLTGITASIVGNNFSYDGSGDYVEDSAGVSVIGYFNDSVIGPNTPASFVFQSDGGTGTIYIGTGTVTGVNAGNVVEIPNDFSAAGVAAAPFVTFGLSAALSGEYSVSDADDSTIPSNVKYRFSSASTRSFFVQNDAGSARLFVWAATGSTPSIELFIDGNPAASMQIDDNSLSFAGAAGFDVSLTRTGTNAWTVEGITTFDDSIILAAGETFAFRDSDNSHETTFIAGNQTGDIDYTLPAVAAAADGYVLQSTTAGVLSWVQRQNAIAMGMAGVVPADPDTADFLVPVPFAMTATKLKISFKVKPSVDTTIQIRSSTDEITWANLGAGTSGVFVAAGNRTQEFDITDTPMAEGITLNFSVTDGADGENVTVMVVGYQT